MVTSDILMLVIILLTIDVSNNCFDSEDCWLVQTTNSPEFHHPRLTRLPSALQLPYVVPSQIKKKMIFKYKVISTFSYQKPQLCFYSCF